MPVDRNDPNREVYCIAVFTVDESAFPEMRRALAGRSTKKIDFRLINATNEDLEDLVRKGRFRASAMILSPVRL